MQQVTSWKWPLRFIAALSLLIAVVWFYFEPGFEPLLAVLGGAVAFISSFFVENISRGTPQLSDDVALYDVNCGSKGIDLANQRLRVSAAFGSYFTGLLERDEGYIILSGQIECPTRAGQEGLPPIQRIFWSLQNPKGSRIFILAAEGGMGKSTLAGKLVRCLYDQEAVDMILGDSAKSEQIDPASGESTSYHPGYSTISGFYQRLCVQLGLPYENDDLALKDIQRRLVNRHAIIVLDNLEVVTHGDHLLQALLKITNRDVRAIVTTRQVNFGTLNDKHLLVYLNPLRDLGVASEFLRWHIDQYQHSHPDLAKLRDDLADKKHVNWLVERSGGIPLLLQLLASDVARSSWEQIRRLPTVFGSDLLNYLYAARWRELTGLGQTGLLAQEILKWLEQEQYVNRKITAKQLTEWAETRNVSSDISLALILLHERFLIVNNDPQKGNYSIFPSLSEFLQKNGKITS